MNDEAFQGNPADIESMVDIASSPIAGDGQRDNGQRQTQDRQRMSNVTRMPERVSLAVAVDPVALIMTECITVTSAMRKHARWAHSSVSAILGGSGPSPSLRQGGSRPATPGDDSGKHTPARTTANGEEGELSLANRWGLRGKKGKSMQDNPLMANFGRLRRDLVECKGNYYP
jgi:hypothetical protein